MRWAVLHSRVLAPASRMAGDDERQMARTREDLVFIVQFLAAAMLAADQAIFTEFLSWLQTLLDWRGVPPQALITGLEALRPVVNAVERGSSSGTRCRAPGTPRRAGLTRSIPGPGPSPGARCRLYRQMGYSRQGEGQAGRGPSRARAWARRPASPGCVLRRGTAISTVCAVQAGVRVSGGERPSPLPGSSWGRICRCGQ